MQSVSNRVILIINYKWKKFYFYLLFAIFVVLNGFVEVQNLFI